MRTNINLYLSLLITFFCSEFSSAQWMHACNDTLPYHNHQNGELMVQTSTNRVYSMQKEVGSTQYRLDYRENDLWNNVLTGTDGLDFVVTDNEIYILRKVSNAFVIENYDLSSSLNWSATCTLPSATAQFSNAELLYASEDTLYVHFIDPGVTNGGSVYRYDGSDWTDLNPGNFKRLKLDNANQPVGLSAVATFNPGNIDYTFKRYNLGTSNWDVIGTVNDQRNYQHCDFVVGKNDTLYLASVTNESNTHVQTYAVANGITVVKDTLCMLVLEFVSAVKLIEDKRGDLWLTFSNTELGPWGWAMARKWNNQIQSWAATPVNFGMVSNEINTEYVPMYPVICDAVVDEFNTYYVSYSYMTDWMWNNPSTHSQVRKYYNCSYLTSVNKVDTMNGELVAQAGSFYDYQWIDCITNTAIPGATESVFPIPGNGIYAVVISNGECSDTSECIDLSTLNNEAIVLVDNIRIYPNPAQDYVMISNLSIDASITITDLSGKLIYYVTGKVGDVLIETANWNPGGYLVKFDTLEHSIRTGFIKK